VREMYKEFKLKQKIKQTNDVWTLVFEPVNGEVNEYKAGQFFLIKLDDADLKPNFKPYSALFPYTPKELSFGIKLHGAFSSKLINLNIGQVVQIDGPYGSFFIKNIDIENVNNIVFIAGGIGITPLLCMMIDLIQNNINKKIYLFYSNKTLEDIAYKEKIDQLEKSTKILKAMILAEINTHTQKGKWG
jgi:ferredoxin-NADP reductase